MKSLNSFTKIKNIVIGSDHAGLTVKKSLIQHLNKNNYTVKDVGAYNEDQVDYPDIASQAITTYYDSHYDLIILICGTGIGMCIAANKHKSIHCALLNNSYSAQMARQHNHANCIAFPARITLQEQIIDILDTFLQSAPEMGRHSERISKITKMELKEKL